MQIRAGNRQDEPLIRVIIAQAIEDQTQTLDLDGRDNDLRNIEANYFWYDGFCLVAEQDAQVIGVIAAKRRDGKEILVLSRLAVASAFRKQGVAKKLLKTALFFAKNMEYKSIEIEATGPSADLLLPEQNRQIMLKLGFKEAKDTNGQKILFLPV